MNKECDFLLKPGLGVDLVFNLDSLSPSSRSSIIYELNEPLRQVTVAQPVHRISPDHSSHQMHISSLIRKELSDKIRVGYPCKIIDIIKGYDLANRGKTEALLLEYVPTLIDINIRSAFRLHPNASYDVLGKMVLNGEIFYSGRHFKFHDISITGIGMLIPKKIQKTRNPLLDLKPDSIAQIGILLKNSEKQDSVTTLECKIKTVRAHMDYNPLSGFAGFSFINLSQDAEETLSRFIHNAQLYNIRKINR